MNKFFLKIAQGQLHKRMREVVELKAGAKVMSQAFPIKSLAIIDSCDSYYRAAEESDQLYDLLINATRKQDTKTYEDMLADSNARLIDVIKQLERLKALPDC